MPEPLALPTPGQLVRVRSRRWLVEGAAPARRAHEQSLVSLACLDDDAQGVRLDVLWEKEVDAEVLDDSSWQNVGRRGFDPPRLFSAYLDTLRWNCVTATDARLFQAPWRAGIDVKAYQLEPLRKALRLPRVNLFIADDVGLGKTIEAGLIVRELLMRQRVRRVVVCCPPSVVQQWREEMEQRFGLTFQVFDRAFVLRKRRERGFGVNAWSTHTRFILSQALLRDEDYAAPLRDWLGDFCPGSLLILDEAHNAAPQTGARYAVDSRTTEAVRDVAPRFEHRLFLSATPHNGHSNSFAALLELLDPQRFCRGVPVRAAHREHVMVRRLKSDLREVLQHGFPERRVLQLDIDGLPDDSAELLLPRLLAEYAALRAERLGEASKSAQAAAALVTTSLQKRLLSSIEAFARTLAVHRRGLERSGGASRFRGGLDAGARALLLSAPGADDERAELGEDEVQAEDDAAMENATRAAEESARAGLHAREQALLDRMQALADGARGRPDARVRLLLRFVRRALLVGDPPRWRARRLLIFTEYADTKRYLEQQLRSALAHTERADERLATFHGGLGEERREELKDAFNADPERHPLRILIATDAAREGVNLQNHCADLFHFDVPWNPARMEQRNGRLDRVLQRRPRVRCRYFFYRQRPEDRVLRALVRKTETIERELGSLSPVIERRLERLLAEGIRPAEADELAAVIGAQAAGESRATVEEELEAGRERRQALHAQIDQLRDMLSRSRDALGLDEDALRDALSCALTLVGAEPLLAESGAAPTGEAQAAPRWRFPALDQRAGSDPTWADTLDTLRPPCPRDVRRDQWRREARPRPIVFRDPGSLDADVVHLHLEHRVVQRLLGRFLAQGFVHDDLSRACVGQSEDPVPRVVLLGRLSLYGEGATRLHDEVVALAARWTAPEARSGELRPYAAEAEAHAVDLLRRALHGARADQVPETQRRRLLGAVARDMQELLPHLRERGAALQDKARAALERRGAQEAEQMRAILEEQQRGIQRKLAEYRQLPLDFADDERRQLEADKRHWERRLVALQDERRVEPERIRALYEVRAARLEPAGLVYLWPVTG